MTVLSRLDGLTVRVHSAVGEIVGEVFFREPSGADLVKINRLQRMLGDSGVTSTPSYLALPFLLCKDESGVPQFDDYDEGLRYIERLHPGALGELTDIMRVRRYLDAERGGW